MDNEALQASQTSDSDDNGTEEASCVDPLLEQVEVDNEALQASETSDSDDNADSNNNGTGLARAAPEAAWQGCHGSVAEAAAATELLHGVDPRAAIPLHERCGRKLAPASLAAEQQAGGRWRQPSHWNNSGWQSADWQQSTTWSRCKKPLVKRCMKCGKRYSEEVNFCGCAGTAGGRAIATVEYDVRASLQRTSSEVLT